MPLDKISYKDYSILKLSFKLWSKLNKRRKYQLFSYLILLLISSFAEVISIASVIPFLSVLALPEKIFNIPSVNAIALSFNIYSPENIRLPITIIFGIIVISTGIIRILNLWVSFRIAASVGSDISSAIFKNIIYKPYLDYSNSGDSIAILNVEINRVINGVIIPQLFFLSSSIICIFLFATLLIINYQATIISALLVILFYFLSINLFKNTLRNNSKLQVKYNQKVIRIIQESLGFIREIILNEKYLFFIKDFDRNNYKLNLINSKSLFIKTYPRILIEPVGIAILSLVGCIIVSRVGFNDALPFIGTLVLGAQRIIPLMQKVYEGVVTTKGAKISLILILELLDKSPQTKKNNEQFILNKINNKSFESFVSLEIRDIYFRYPNDSKYIFNGINLKINKGDKIAIIGESGSGKSTLVDLLMGLIPPISGDIFINNYDINHCMHKDIRNWRSNLSLVSQNIFLSDSSIKENIAFGIEEENIDYPRIYKTLEISNLVKLVETKKNGIDTLVGENGISLSGGQCQRLAIARGLYKNADFLLLDEATSSLDYETENKILKNLCSSIPDITIVMITHRRTNLNFCNKILKVDDGNLIEIKK